MLRGCLLGQGAGPASGRSEPYAPILPPILELLIDELKDLYSAEKQIVREMAKSGQVENVVPYATNTLAIMVLAGNPKHIMGLKDLGSPSLRLSMPNPEWEGVANQIGDSLRKAGGDSLFVSVYKNKVADGSTKLTEIHHRQTPMRILGGQADAGVTWASEVKFQEKTGNPITGVDIPADQNMTAIYAGGIVKNAPHAEMAHAWLEYLKTPEAQGYYHQFGFRSIDAEKK